MANSTLRVLLDLTELNIASFKYVWINVSTRELQNIADFKADILKKLNLGKKDIRLFVRDGLLLEHEKIFILREEDTVKILYDIKPESVISNEEVFVADSYQKSVLKRSAEEYEDNISSRVRKRKKNSEPLACMSSTAMKAGKERGKKRKHKRSWSKDKSKSLNNTADMSLLDNHQESVLMKSAEECENDTSLTCTYFCDYKPHSTCNTTDKSALNKNHETVVNSNIENCFNKNSLTSVRKQKIEKKLVTSITSPLMKTDVKSKKKTCKSLCSIPDMNNISIEESLVISDNEKGFAEEFQFSDTLNDYKSVSPQGVHEKISPKTTPNKDIINYKPVSSHDQDLLIGTTSEKLNNVEENQGNSCKKKRRRHRKRKSATNVIGTYELNVGNDQSNSYFESNTENSHCSSVRNHILFTSPSASESLPSASEKMSVKYVNLDSYVAKFKATNNLETASMLTEENFHKLTKTFTDKPEVHRTVSTPILHDRLKLKDWTVTPIQNELNTGTSSSPTKIPVERTLKNETSKKPEYTDFPSLSSLPAVGARIAYKVLELNSDYSPEVSDFKEGIIKRIDPEIDEIEIELVKEEVKEGRTGKFENLREDEIPSPEIIKRVVVQWPNLIDPRLMSS